MVRSWVCYSVGLYDVPGIAFAKDGAVQPNMPVNRQPSALPSAPPQIRKDFPETWLWSNHLTGYVAPIEKIQLVAIQIHVHHNL